MSAQDLPPVLDEAMEAAQRMLDGTSEFTENDSRLVARALLSRRSLRAERDAVLEGLVEAAFRLGVSDGLKHGPIAAKWCCTPERARDSIRALKAEGAEA